MLPTTESVTAPDTSHVQNALDNDSGSNGSTEASDDNASDLHPLPSTAVRNHSLRIFYINAGGMRSKISNFYAAVSVCDFDVIIVTETWLVPSILDSELIPRGWQIFRRDRHRDPDSSALGGGVLIMVRDSLLPSLVTSSIDDIEHIWAQLLAKGKKLIVGGAYVPPQSNEEIYRKLAESCAEISGTIGDEEDALLCCDVNLPGIHWQPHDEIPGVFLPTEARGENDLIVSEGLLQHGWFQLNGQPNSHGNLLETIFCSRHDEIEICCPAPALCDGFGSSNAHHPVSLTYDGFHVTHINDCSSRAQLDFAKADYPRLMEHLQTVDWNLVLGSGDVDSKVSKLYCFLNDCLPTFIPTKTQHRKRCRTRPWMSSSLARLRNRKRAAA